MSDAAPLVVGVMLTADRPEMTARAIRSFEEQTYERKCLLVFDSGREKLNLPTSIRQIYSWVNSYNGGELTVGHLRNIANAMAGGADIIAHFDSDDWSHPRRLEEQVALLQASGADCVGYNEILFWDTMASKYATLYESIENFTDGVMPPQATSKYADITRHGNPPANEAWIYENDALDIQTKFNPGYEDSYPPVGASYCYWSAVWERLPFAEIDKGEDTDWKRRGTRCYGETCFRWLGTPSARITTRIGESMEPRLICEIHGANTNSSIQRGFAEFRRAPQWDEYCREKMEQRVTA